MDCFSDDDLTINSYTLLSDISLNEEKEKLKLEAREQCCFCVLFSGVAVGSTISAVATAGTTLPVDVPSIGVSVSSAALCFKQVLNKNESIKNVDKELNIRKDKQIKYVDNVTNLCIYDTTDDSIHKIYHPII